MTHRVYFRGAKTPTRIATRVAATMLLAVAATLLFEPRAFAADTSFVGDYSSGDFSQWPVLQNKDYNGPGAAFSPTYSASIVKDDVHGAAARFEVRPGEPNEHGTQRSEVMGGPETGGAEGQVMWYQFSTKFHSDFPLNHASFGQGITNQFWSVTGAGPPLSWSVGKRNGFWSLSVQKQQKADQYLRTFSIFHTPIDVGKWHEVTMQIRWSASDDRGWIRLWLNGQRQVFIDGSDTFRVRTLIPDTDNIRYKEGYYREQSPSVPVGVVYHAGFRCGPGDPPLQ